MRILATQMKRHFAGTPFQSRSRQNTGSAAGKREPQTERDPDELRLLNNRLFDKSPRGFRNRCVARAVVSRVNGERDECASGVVYPDNGRLKHLFKCPRRAVTGVRAPSDVGQQAGCQAQPAIFRTPFIEQGSHPVCQLVSRIPES